MPFLAAQPGAIVLLPGIKVVPSVVEVQSLNHSTRKPLCTVDECKPNTAAFPQKVKDGTSIRPSHSTSGRLFTGYGTKTSKRYLHPYT